MFLRAQGFRVLRFTNHDVMQNVEGVCEVIMNAVRTNDRTSPPQPPLPPGRGGGVSVARPTRAAGSMIILGIDPGFGRMGYGVLRVERGVERMVTCGVVETPKGDLAPRLLAIRDGLRDLFATHHPDRVAIERLYFSKNVKTAIDVAQARGVIVLTCAEAGVPIVEPSPQDVKMAVTGYGAAEKPQVQEMVRVLLKLTAIPKPDDAADALAIAFAGSRVMLHSNAA